MGCFYETCGLSNFPIEPGEKARLFILEKGSVGRGGEDEDEDEDEDGEDGRNGFCYPTSLWSPAGLPLFGVYDDDHEHGSLRKGARWVGGEHTEAALKERGIPIGAKEFLHDLARGKVKCRQVGSRGALWSVGYMLVRDDVWQEMLLLPYPHLFKPIALRLDDAKKDASWWVEATKEIATDYRSVSRFERRARDHESDSGFLRMISSDGCESMPRFAYYGLTLLEGLTEKTITPSQAHKVLCDLAEVYHVSKLMGHLRLAWAPQVGLGSQTTAWPTQQAFKATLANVAARRQEERQR